MSFDKIFGTENVVKMPWNKNIKGLKSNARRSFTKISVILDIFRIVLLFLTIIVYNEKKLL